MQINQMRQNVAGGGGQQGGGDLGVDQPREVFGAGGAVLQGRQDLGLTGEAVTDQPGQAGGGVMDSRAVTGQYHGPIALRQKRQ